MNKPEERVLDENGFEHLLDVKDVAEKLGIGRNKAYALMKARNFPGIRIGGSYRVFEDDLYSYLKDNRGNKIKV